MRYAIFADVHGNLEALDAVLAALEGEHIDSYLCVGDMVGYGADPGACLAQLKRHSVVLIAGNHDWAAAGKRDIEYFNPLAQVAILWTRDQLGADQKRFLGELPLVFENADLTLVHGTLDEPENFHYLNTLGDAARTFTLMQPSLCFVGHNHIPAIMVQKSDGATDRVPGYSVQRVEGCRYIVNVGSVGQPRDGCPQAAYCVYDSSTGTIAIKRVSYPIQSAQEKILFAGLPAKLAYRLAIGS